MKTRIFIGLAVMLMTLFGITAYANENNDNPTTEANIDGLNYFLGFTTHEATITTGHTVSGELNIPSEINYKGETFVVKGMAWCSFYNNQGLTKVTIPKTVEGILNYVPHNPEDETSGAVAPINMNPFKGCTALESIEVDEENPSFKSVDGVLFSQDGVGQYYYHTNNYKGTGLYCYPEGKQQHIYTIPDGVEWIGGGAVSNNKYLTTLTIPNSMKHICTSAFEGCSNLKELYCKADNVPVVWESVFKNVPIASATLHVPAGSIEKYKATSPWNEFREIVTLEEEQAKLIICVTNNDETSPIDTLYTEDEILWFNDSTREIKFMYSDEEVREKLRSTRSNSKYLEFRLGENVLLKATVTSNVMSHIITDLVLCMGSMERRPYSYAGFFLYDCYPLNKQTINDERTQANIQKRAPQWEIFLKHWESKGKLRHDPIDLVSFSQGKRATIILPTTPDASKGKYYRLDRWENGKIIFEEEPNPQARTPYIIVPERDFTIDLSSIDAPDHFDTISIEGVRFIGTYTKREIYEKDNGYGYYIIDKTSDCVYHPDNKDCIIMGALHGHFEVRLDFCYNKEKGEYWDKLEYVLHDIPVSYFPDGTKWTEIRLDTLKYDSWYSKVGDEWVPNFETVEYYVKGEYVEKGRDDDFTFKKVYTNGPEWTDSLTLLISESQWGIEVSVAIFNEDGVPFYPGRAYMFDDWREGYMLSYQTIDGANIPSLPAVGIKDYGTITEIKEGYFGGEKLLKYVDLNGIRIIHGIGVTEWNDGECIFGPVDPYSCYYGTYPGMPKNRDYRSMLVHFERNGEVLYDVWPAKETVSYTKDQMATIILPSAPDASKGKYYRLDRCEEGKIIFTEELQPKARVPYIIVPKEDFTIDLSKLELESLLSDTVSVKGAMFIGSYNSAELNCQEGFYIDIIDSTPDCQIIGTDQRKATIGALRAFLIAPWDDPYTQGPTKGIKNKRAIVLQDDPNGTESIHNSQFIIHNDDAIYDLSGRRLSGKPSRGVYIKNHRKVAIK